LLDNIGMLYMQKKNGEDFTLPKSYTKRRWNL
jgi:hypothetical protein